MQALLLILLASTLTWTEGNENIVAVAPTMSKKLGFDLNLMSDADYAPPCSSWSFDIQNFNHLNGHPSSSPASSLFPMQPTLSIDFSGPAMQSGSSRPHPLLGRTSFSKNGNVHLHPFYGMSSPQNVSIQKDAKPSISIMGACVEVNRNSSHGDPSPSLSNGKSENHLVETNIGAVGSYLSVGPTASYGHPSPFPYSDRNAGPTMAFMSPMFRPGYTMTYMVDPRVGPIAQMVNSPSAVPHMYARSPFLMSMAGPPQSLNGV